MGNNVKISPLAKKAQSQGTLKEDTCFIKHNEVKGAINKKIKL